MRMITCQGYRLGPLTQCTVAVDGPFGAPGTVLWLCNDHAQLLSFWNNKEIDATVASKKAQQIMSAVRWPVY